MMPEKDGSSSDELATGSLLNQTESVKVAVRLRPFTEKERQRNSKRIVDIEKNTVVLYSPRYGDVSLKKFTFDHSYWSHDGFLRNAQGLNVPDPNHPHSGRYIGQEGVFNDVGLFLLNNTLEGYNAVLLAYGPTGSGKSYTVSGYGHNEGILPRFARSLFVELDKKVGMKPPSDGICRYEVHFSMMEIYNEVVRDLLATHQEEATKTRKGLRVREHPKRGFFVQGLTLHLCANKQEIQQRIEQGQLNKSIAATSMNETSSRGHTIYEFNIKQFNSTKSSSGNKANCDETMIISVVQLVDLAGSERMAVHAVDGITGSFISGRSNSPSPNPNRPNQFAESPTINISDRVSRSAVSNKSQAVRKSAQGNGNSLRPDHEQRFKESVSINQSLSTLGKCIQIMSQYSQQLTHSAAKDSQKKMNLRIPYRDSVLTKLLNRCLNGDSKVVIIATLSPADSDYDDTLSTLRFADRAKQIKTHAIINRIRKDLGHQAAQACDDQSGTEGKATKSDDSSQTSERDFALVTPKVNHGASNSYLRTPTRARNKRLARLNGSNLELNSSGLQRPAQETDLLRSGGSIHKSRSVANGLARQGSINEEGLDDDLRDIHGERFLSPDSDDDSWDGDEADELMTDEQKIELSNRVLSNRIVSKGPKRAGEDSQPRSVQRNPRPNARRRSRIKQVSRISSSLKRTNPYLTNLNADEQLTHVMNFIIKEGVTTIGKDGSCDIVLHGPEILERHAKITRTSRGPDGRATVFIEPYSNKQISGGSALMVNGRPLTGRIGLNHCDRLLFGSNAFFVFVDNITSSDSTKVHTVADLDLVTYNMARSEVMRKVMEDKKNDKVVKEIREYVHRPGTGKQYSSSRTSSLTKSGDITEAIIPPLGSSIQNRQFDIPSNVTADDSFALGSQYKDQLMQDTYEYTLPVAEVNAVAKEMNIRVRYSLKILTGEEQIHEEVSPSRAGSDILSSSSSNNQAQTNAVQVSKSNGGESFGEPQSQDISYLKSVGQFDVPPALFIKVHLEEPDVDFYWSKGKFQTRRNKILELYGAWEDDKKSGLVEFLIDQTRYGNEYVFDPFIDDVRTTFVLIGHSQVNFHTMIRSDEMSQSYDVLNLDDEVVGRIKIQAKLCHDTEENSVTGRRSQGSDIEHLLDKRLVFMLKIISCQDLPKGFINVFCQYSLQSPDRTIRTKMLREDSMESYEDGELLFEHLHYICFEKVTMEILDFLEHGFLTIQALGQHKLPSPEKPLTVVSTIISSISKYRYHIESQMYYGIANSNDIYNNNTNLVQGNQSAPLQSDSATSSMVSSNTIANLYDQHNGDEEDVAEDDENSMNGMANENAIEMILTKRKLDRAENQLMYLKRTVNIAEHYNKKHIPVKTVKKVLDTFAPAEPDEESILEASNDARVDKNPDSPLSTANLERSSTRIPTEARAPKHKERSTSFKPSMCTLQ